MKSFMYWFQGLVMTSLVEQELPTLPVHLTSPPVFCGVRVTRSLDLCLLAIVLSVLLRYTDFDYPFGIFKLFFVQLIYSVYKYTNHDWLFLVVDFFWRNFSLFGVNLHSFPPLFFLSMSLSYNSVMAYFYHK
jgi:hypothetical protein